MNEEYTLALNNDAYIIYYPIDVAGNKLVISIDDNPIVHIYNVYLNNVSLVDGTKLNDSYLAVSAVLEKGFLNFFKCNWFKIIKENFLEFIGAVVTVAVICGYTLKEFNYRICCRL